MNLEQQRDQTFTQLSELVATSPTSYHAATNVARTLIEAGFTELHEHEDWGELDAGGYVLVRDGAVIAWRIPPVCTPTTPFAVVAVHTDSPGFRLKPVPHTERAGWCSVNAEVYGGPLLNSWLDRDLRLGARLALSDGSMKLAATDAVARIPQLAIHLDRQVNVEGLKLDRQQHTHAVVGLAGGPGPIDLLASAAGVERDEVVAWDAFFADAQPGARLGSQSELLAAGRLDNLVSVHAGMRAIVSAAPEGVIPVLAAFDHEEVGSDTRTGAGGPLLGDVLDRIGASGTTTDRQRARAASWVVSSDVGHAVHPNYGDRHDDDVRPIAGQGTIIKINADQRYVTDAAGEALWRRLSAQVDVPVQTFVSKNSMPCGSTVGPITATRYGMRTVDVGIPILSMHSARELAAIDDVTALQAVLSAFMSSAQ